MSTQITHERLKTMQTENQPSKPETELKQQAGEGCSRATCSRSFSEVMFQLERLIHQHDDQPETSGYHQDALWLEEVRHHVCRLERELGKARTTIAAIDERYIDGCDTYDDWKFMGDTARAFLSKNAEAIHGEKGDTK